MDEWARGEVGDFVKKGFGGSQGLRILRGEGIWLKLIAKPGKDEHSANPAQDLPELSRRGAGARI